MVKSSEGTGPITQAAFARLQGVTPPAVKKAIAKGRLVDSIETVKGVAMIRDPTLAAEEWLKNSNYSRRVDLEPGIRRHQRSLADPDVESSFGDIMGDLEFVGAYRDLTDVVLAVKTDRDAEDGWHEEHLTQAEARYLAALLLQKAASTTPDFD